MGLFLIHTKRTSYWLDSPEGPVFDEISWQTPELGQLYRFWFPFSATFASALHFPPHLYG
jgi:hypothetical protein